MKILQRMAAISLLLIGSCVTGAQEKLEARRISTLQEGAKPTNCEFNVSILTGADRVAGQDGLVIIVARLGQGERNRDLNRRRLHNAKTFLTLFGHRASETIITAVGERVEGYGRIELYADGKLFHALTVNANDDLAVGSCSFEGNHPCTYEREKKLYPCLAKRRVTPKR